MVWGLGDRSGKENGKEKGPVDKRSANPSSRSSSKEKQPTIPSGKGVLKRPADSASPPSRRPAAPVPIQLQPSDEIFFCCMCLIKKVTSHPTENPRRGHGIRPDDQCMDCGHIMCEATCAVQKAWEPIGSWILRLAERTNTHKVLPWGLQPGKLWKYSSFQYLEYQCYPPFFCCNCMKREDPLFNTRTNPISKTTPYLRCHRRDKKAKKGNCEHPPCGNCKAVPWTKEELEGQGYTPPQAQHETPSISPPQNKAGYGSAVPQATIVPAYRSQQFSPQPSYFPQRQQPQTHYTNQQYQTAPSYPSVQSQAVPVYYPPPQVQPQAFQPVQTWIPGTPQNLSTGAAYANLHPPAIPSHPRPRRLSRSPSANLIREAISASVFQTPEVMAWRCKDCINAGVENASVPIVGKWKCPNLTLRGICGHTGLSCGDHCERWVYSIT